MALLDDDLPLMADPPREAPVAPSGSIAWQVAVPGYSDPVLVLAASKAGAIEQASKLTKGAPMSGAVATRLGEVLDEQGS